MVTAFDADADWYLVPSRQTVATGSVSVEFNNRYAADPHNLRIERASTVFEFPTLDKEQALERRFAFTARDVDAVVHAARAQGEGHGRHDHRGVTLVRRCARLTCDAALT